MERYNLTVHECRKGHQCNDMAVYEDGEWVKYADAQATVEALQARVRELEQPVYVCQGCGRLGRDGWLPTSFTSDELHGSVQCPDCGCIDREKNTARELAAICTKAQSELTQRTAELEAAANYYKQPSKNGGVYSVSGGHIGNLMDWCKDNLKHCKFSGPDEDNLDLDLVQTAQQIPQLKTELSQLQALVREMDSLLKGIIKRNQGGYVGDKDDIRKAISLVATLNATTPAPRTDEQRFIAACCERPDDCKWGGTGGCGYEGRQPKGGDGE